MSGTRFDPIVIPDDGDSDVEIIEVVPRGTSEPRGGGTVTNRAPMHLDLPNLVIPAMDYAPPVVEARMTILCTIHVGDVLSAFVFLVLRWFF